jgi:predicted nucleotidyltransferase component of viral defense system
MNADQLRRLAKDTGFDVATLEKDYALTWLIAGIYSEDSNLKDILIFKGGTAIRKVYFPEWRLSEDLDFTILQRVNLEKVKQNFEQVFNSLKGKSGITYSFSAFNHGIYTILADVQFLGPLDFKNRIAHDISLKEKLVEEPERKKVKPEYEDIPEAKVLVYSLNEILVEKIRSIFQRGKARDYYDVWRLTKEKDFSSHRIRELLIQKCEISGVEFRPDLIFDGARLSEAKKFWTISLTRLTRDLPDFDKVITELKDRLSFLQE